MLRVLLSIWIIPQLTRSSNIISKNIQQSKSGDSADVSLCVRNIIGEILNHDTFVIDVYLLNIDDVLEIHKIHGIKKARFITASSSWEEKNVHKPIYVTEAAEFGEFKNIINHTITRISYNPVANYVIVLRNYKDYHYQDMVNFLVANNIYNVTILARNDSYSNKEDYGIYTLQSPIHPCNQREKIIKVSDCSIYKGGVHIFPKIGALRGCNFSLFTHNIFPLINLDNPNEEGIEQRILRYFAMYNGINITLIPFSKMNKFGKIFSNFSYTFLLEKALTSEVDGAVGGYLISQDHFENMFTLSYPLTIDNLMVIVPRSHRMDVLHTFFNQNNFLPTLLVFLTMIVFSITSYLFSVFPAPRSDIARDTLLVIGYFLNKCITRKFKSGIPETMLICCLLFAIIIIPFSIQALMWSFKTHPIRAWEPQLYEEVIKNYELILPSESRKTTSQKNKKECYNRLDCLKILRDEKDNYYTLLTESLFETYKWMVTDERCNLRHYKLKKPATTLMRAIYFKRGSVLKIPFDNFHLKLNGAGLVRQHADFIIFRERMKCKPKLFVPDVAPLHLRDFKIPYNLLIGGYCLSAMAFAYEVLSSRKYI